MKVSKTKLKHKNFKLSRRNPALFVLVFAIIGATFFLTSHAATPYASVNADQGTLSCGAQIVTDTNAADGHAVKFGMCGSGGGLKCGLVNAAFCDTFDAPAGIGDRAGDLNGTVWGASRLLGSWNFGQNQYNATEATTLQKCGQSVPVQPDNDIAICNGQVAEAQTDQHGVTSLAMYPKQPFDIAGRTGKIVFDVSDDSHGNHRAWPEIWYTDKPMPAPFTHFSSLQSVPKDGFGVRFAETCPVNSGGCGARGACPEYPQSVPVVTIDSAVVINNYVSNDSFAGDVPNGSINVQQVDCVKQSSGPGDMNHFELDVSQNEIDVYGTDAGTTTPLKKIAVITGFNLTLTRGLVWMEDVHYNGDKDGPDQGTHTFTWDNFGFDGPVLPRDLAFDVPDRLQSFASDSNGVPTTLLNLGWPVPSDGTTTLSLNIPGVHNVSSASGAVLTFNYYSDVPVTISYKLNNGAWHNQPYPFPCASSSFCTGERSIAVPVPVADAQAGTNTVQFKSSDGTGISNVDLILVGAGGIVNP